MGFSFEFTPEELTEAVRPQLREVAESIADRAATRFRFSRHRDRSKFVVEDTKDGVNVSLASSFGHLDEWGGPKSRPTGAMRSAAAEFGTFTPEPKPS